VAAEVRLGERVAAAVQLERHRVNLASLRGAESCGALEGCLDIADGDREAVEVQLGEGLAALW
jgi:hypothetical protein